MVEDGRAYCYEFLVSLTCANLAFTVELVASKGGERWSRGSISNKQCGEGLCQGLAPFVLVSPTCSNKPCKRVQPVLLNYVDFPCNSYKRILLEILPVFYVDIILKKMAIIGYLKDES